MLRKLILYSIQWIAGVYADNLRTINIRNYREQNTIGDNFCKKLGAHLRIYNMGNKENVVIGDNVNLDCKINCNRNGKVYIGDNTSIREKSIINCDNNIYIGAYCFIGNNVLIQDNDSHPESTIARKLQSLNSVNSVVDTYESINQPIKICDGVWIGTGAIVLKGVTIEKGSIIGAGSVVTHDVPAKHIAAGNPANIIRKIQEK